jgi:Raf kinase inhibitor-like YbhB/YbcL family protein
MRALDCLLLNTGRARAAALMACVVIACMALACPPAAAEDKMKMTSIAFGENQPIPRIYTCEGKDLSPPLAWSGVLANAKSLALVVDDPDAPDPKAPRMTWVHWVLYNIPPSAVSLPEGVRASDLPKGTLEGLNDWKRTGYGGPCPPIGRHRYFHKLYALDTVLPDLGKPTKAALEKAMEGHIVEQAQLVGTYEKGK